MDDERWFLALQSGQILSFSSSIEDEDLVEVLDIAERMELPSSESGLVGFALHPDFPSTGYAYVVYSAPSDGDFDSRLSRFALGEGGVFDPDSETVLLAVPQTNAAHTGNHIAFGPGGHLYFALGDDQRSAHAQDPSTLPGSILRINVDVPDMDRGTEYSIPPDNPFFDGVAGAPEVYAYGLRNPWRFTIDSESGEIYAGDVGQRRREEINLIGPGENYGWPHKEGLLCSAEEACEDSAFSDPIVDIAHPELRSIVAGFRYGGDQVPALDNRVLFADFVTGSIYSIDPGAAVVEARLELEGEFMVVSFAKARNGDIFVLRYATRDSEGGIYRIVGNAPQETEFPTLLSETGCVNSSNARLPAEGVVPYRPIAPLWSDGSEKRRWLSIPDDQRIGVLRDGLFDMPNGSVLIKEFAYGGRPHETRLFMRYENEWQGYSYRWNEDGSDAVLVDTAVATTLPGGDRWQFPSRSACRQCHSEGRRILGLEVAQLDHVDEVEDGSQANQLSWLIEHDYFYPEIQNSADLLAPNYRLVDPQGDAPLEERARSYLHVNCSNCHRPGGVGRGDIDLRASATLAEMNVCDEEARTGLIWSEGNADAQRLLAPGAPEDSLITIRMRVEGRFRMPPLGSYVPDDDGLALVSDWIESVSTCP